MLDYCFEELAPIFGNYQMVLVTLTLPSAVLTGICAVESIWEKDIEKKKDNRAWLWLFLSVCIITAVIAVLWRFQEGDVR